MDVIEPCAVMDAVRRDRVRTSDELAEKRVALLTASRDAREGRVLSFDAQSRVLHDEHDEARLTVRQPIICDRLHAFQGPHFKNSSASPPCSQFPPRQPPPPRPIRALLPLWQEKPVRATAAPWAPR